MIAEYHWPGDVDRPALALHCSMGSSSYWAPIARVLGDSIDLRAFDAPGHGKSAAWAGEDIHGTLTRLAAERIGRPLDLIGHSLGATVALRIAVAAPDAVRTLTLVEPVLFAAAPELPQPTFTQMEALLAENRDEEATRAFIDLWGEAPFDSLPPSIRKRMTSQVRMVAEANDVLVHDRAHLLRPGGLEGIDAPVMLIRGSDSPPVIEAIGDALAARLADVARAVVPGAGHMVPITHPEETAGLIAVNLDRG